MQVKITSSNKSSYGFWEDMPTRFLCLGRGEHSFELCVEPDPTIRKLKVKAYINRKFDLPKSNGDEILYPINIQKYIHIIIIRQHKCAMIIVA